MKNMFRENTCSVQKNDAAAFKYLPSLSSAGSALENETLLHETSKLFHGSAVFLRRNTAVLRRNMRLLRRNTAVLLENKRLLRGNLKHPPDCTLKFLILLVLGEEETRLDYHKLLLLSNPAMQKWYAYVLLHEISSCKR